MKRGIQVGVSGKEDHDHSERSAISCIATELDITIKGKEQRPPILISRPHLRLVAQHLIALID